MIRKSGFWNNFWHNFREQPTTRSADYLLMVVIGLLTFLGLLMLSSASSVQAFQKFNNSYYFLEHQITRGLIPGLIAFFIFSRVNYHYWKKYAVHFLIITVLMLILVFIPGIGAIYNNVHSWIKIGFLSFQPAELAKLTFLIYLATWLDKKITHQNKFSQVFLPFISVLGLIAILMLLQPDTGTLLVIIASSLIVYFATGIPWRQIIAILIGGFILLFLAIQLTGYRSDRIGAFFNPEKDPLGVGYHITQAKIAIGSGGFLGLGIGKSRQKFNYLPEVSGDSIFAIIAEEMGFVFSLILILLFGVLMFKGLKIARASPDNYGKYLAIGITSWISFQALTNIAGIVGLIPMTGIPLPFISYGGSALLVTLAGCGILINISKNTKNDL